MRQNRSATSCIAALILIISISSCNSETAGTKETNIDSIQSAQLMGAGFGIASATILVNNLDSAIKYYNDSLGFKFSPVDTSAIPAFEGTKSSYTSFPDWSGMELLAIKDSALVAQKNSFINDFLKKYEGARLYTLSTSSADTTMKWLHTQGFNTDTITSGRNNKKAVKGWTWDDGNAQWHNIAFNRKSPPASLPDFMEYTGASLYEYKADWRPYTWRKYYDSLHNGVVAMAYVQIVVKNLDSASKDFTKMGMRQLNSSDSTARFKTTYDQYIELISPKPAQTEAGKFLQSRGEGVFAIGFEVKKLHDTYEFFKKKLPAKALVMDSVAKKLSVLKEYAYGVQLDFVEESKAISDLAAIYGYKDDKKLDSVSVIYASGLYTKYCALCHGNDRQGYAADNAPSLKSKELLAVTQTPRASYNYLVHTISYGRTGTAMAPYAKEQGGPLDYNQVELLIKWLYDTSGVKKPVELSSKPVTGDVTQGKTLYAAHCARCHGANGEGVNAPALANPMFLATASDAFIQYTITNGRENTPMRAFKDSLKKTEIDAITAFLRSRATGWNAPAPITVKEPDPKDYVLNPKQKAPSFKLKDGRYVPAEQVLKALKDSSRMIILDARSKAAWNQTHIPGAIPVPYYDEPDTFIKNIPNDDTWIIVYCACPHAASDKVVNTLRRFKYKNTAIIDEGVLVWAQRGYPVQYGQDAKDGKKKGK